LSPPYGDPIVPLTIPTDEEQRISQPSILMDDYTCFGKEGEEKAMNGWLGRQISDANINYLCNTDKIPAMDIHYKTDPFFVPLFLVTPWGEPRWGVCLPERDSPLACPIDKFIGAFLWFLQLCEEQNGTLVLSYR
jgi:hypothetical protein